MCPEENRPPGGSPRGPGHQADTGDGLGQTDLVGAQRGFEQLEELRPGSYGPDRLLERRRRAEQALPSVVATGYLLRVSTRRVEKLVGQSGITRLSTSRVGEMSLGRWRPFDHARSRGPYSFVWLDALTQKVREHGRTMVVHALIAVGSPRRAT